MLFRFPLATITVGPLSELIPLSQATFQHGDPRRQWIRIIGSGNMLRIIPTVND